MATLVDLPEELLCSICEKAEPSTLLSLAASCKLLNRISGSQYLLFISRDSQDPFLSVADEVRMSFETSFETLRNIMSIAGSISTVRFVSFQFSPSARKTLQQIRLATLLLQRIHHPLHSLEVNFNGVESDIPCFSPSFNMFPSFNGAFNGLLWEAYRLRYCSLRLAGIIPITQDCFKFSPPINTSLSHITVDATFLLSRAQREWLVGFLNASKAIFYILARGSEGWTYILPNLSLPSLKDIAFIGRPTVTASPIEIVAEFCNQHQNLRSIDCGPYQFRTSPTSKLGCQYPLSQLQVLRASVSQLLYFVSDPSRLRNLEVIEIQWPEFDDDIASTSDHSSTGLWHLFTFLCNRSSIRNLIIPTNFPGLQKDVRSEAKSSLTSTFPSLTMLQLGDFKSLVELARQDFLKWVLKVFPSLKSLDFAYTGWDAEETSCFARIVAKELPSIENLTLDYKPRKVKDWIEDPSESTKA
ncbi:hypothetical protein BDP27DRAFT_1453467 [Rhodocollybia butyracea]|uniref:F-box domain-containing protein n=1 Tax=Rhodocollybia butyracea TaxID=206335 RepID=A0A9P5P929_9AGAR|nr:hypothetical protein BDP27DRAFT_1453467 [Rhodocollybia butyracea]